MNKRVEKLKMGRKDIIENKNLSRSKENLSRKQRGELRGGLKVSYQSHFSQTILNNNVSTVQ